PRRVLGLPQSMRRACPIVQSRQAFATVPINPFSNGPRADAYGLRDGLRRLPALDLQYNPLSTARRQPGILMHVHPVLRWTLKLQQPQLPRSEPDGQPTESSQLGSQRAQPVLAVLRTGDSTWTTSRVKNSSRLPWLQSAQSSSPSTRSASFGRRDGSGTAAMANTTCR